ncbi:hypothetical protein FNH13_04100 [Ornithinimicrobium ciconiae]|uniref:DUF47 family protein n=1 Tax=Ornithinimicrobium ciconiae TaxID=2594265 RepID=A0A516G7X1_9MICO|nr:hypothetical protein [Ornithinimicrobium ciconiae]QDO87621.1 hypothetical protein FNH13_04100 [Ornithinimicrobium ciconiae]
MVQSLTRLAGLVVDGAVVLRDTLGTNSRGRTADLERLRGIEGEARAMHAEIVGLARDAFVTPFDRGDLQQLSVRLVESVTRMEAVVDGGIRHGIDESPEGAARLVDAVVRLAELTAQAMANLGSVDLVSGYPSEARRLTQQAERARRDIMTEALRDRVDPLVALRTVSVTEQITLAVRCFEQVAAVVEGIVVKES